MADSKFKTVLVTGGAGFIGSHCAVSLLKAGYTVIACDNFVNATRDTDGRPVSLNRVVKITGKQVTFYECDLLDSAKLENIFQKVTNMQ